MTKPFRRNHLDHPLPECIGPRSAATIAGLHPRTRRSGGCLLRSRNRCLSLDAHRSPGTGAYAITFTATDDGVPPLSGSETVTITVVEPPRPVTVSGVEVRDGQFRFTFAAQAGKTYLVQAKNNLDDPVWIDLLVIPAPPSTVEFAEPLPGTGTRYYRVITSE